MTQQWIAAFMLAIVVAGAAYKARALSVSGAVAAILLGTVVVGTGGWWPGIILVAFFASSSVISRINTSLSIDQAKGGQRDWLQVLANGWGVLAGCILFAITEWQPWLLFSSGAIAAATADTWSSEIGRTSSSFPRLVTTWKLVARGTSGAISTKGSIASLAGSVFIATILLIAMTYTDFLDGYSRPIVASGTVFAGFIGGMFDSILGATIQERRWCDVCNVRTEANPHSCGAETRVIGGIRGFSNDVVNFLCVLCGALIGLISSIL